MPGIVARGRTAWILAVIVGVILLIIGIVSNTTFLTIVGAGFLILGGIFLILSLATGGRTD